MINALVSAFLKLVLYIFGLIASLITAPVFALLSAVFPDFSSFLSDFNYFISYYVVKGIAFAREVFLNVSGYPRALLQLLITLYMARLTFHLLSIPIKFIINTYKFYKGGGGQMVE